MSSAKRDTGKSIQAMAAHVRSIQKSIKKAIVCSIFLIIFSGLPWASLVYGILYINQCPKQSMIPIWLIGNGVSGIILLYIWILYLICQLCRDHETDLNEKKNVCFICTLFITVILLIFFIAWLIAGGVWMFSLKYPVDVNDPTSNNYCDYSTLENSFVFIIMELIMVGLCDGKNTYLLLGPIGTGAFGNKVDDIADVFHEVLNKKIMNSEGPVRFAFENIWFVSTEKWKNDKFNERMPEDKLDNTKDN
ncbi:unnamed protein product [Adineta steineri]|uniref:Uncharacterized protein n=1 Tax=Adineta steineri TaxID=433720 RepID=A0A819MRJ4_9BILA|nr:unnamed protein product [Adineta steineri]